MDFNVGGGVAGMQCMDQMYFVDPVALCANNFLCEGEALIENYFFEVDLGVSDA